MIGWIARVLLAISGAIAGLFISREAMNFGIIQMVVAVLLFTAFVAAVAFWPTLMRWFGWKQNLDN